MVDTRFKRSKDMAALEAHLVDWKDTADRASIFPDLMAAVTAIPATVLAETPIFKPLALDTVVDTDPIVKDTVPVASFSKMAVTNMDMAN